MTSPEESNQDDLIDEDDSFEESVDQDADLESPLDDVGEWGSDELEAAYMKAMSTLEAVESEIAPAEEEEVELDFEQIAAQMDAGESTDDPATSGNAAPSAPGMTPEEAAASIAELMAPLPNAAAEQKEATEAPPVEVRVLPRQIIEACLFVGGEPLTSKKIMGVLRGEFDVDYIDREIDELNRQYAAENRPYEIRLVEGGFRMALREEFERIRNKVYGLGPKEVRLSQEALEVLAVVAYHQPIKQKQVEELGKPGCGAVLRQLVRRELLAVERDPAQPRDVNYKTTPRFLTLFGISTLDDLPRHEQVAYK